MPKRKERLLTINIIVLGIALLLFAGIVAVLLLVFRFDEGLFFGMVLAFLFPMLLVLAVVGALVYVALFVSNVLITLRRKKTGALSRQLGYTWLVFGGVTLITSLVVVLCGVVGAPVVALMARTLEERNPLLTAPVRSVPTYPATVWDDQSQYDEMDETLFRSYNVPNTHPDDVAEWYQGELSQQPWSVVRVDRYIENDEPIGRVVRHCVQAQRSERNGQLRTYYVEIFGGDEPSVWGTHVNIGTPNPITDVCEQFLEVP